MDSKEESDDFDDFDEGRPPTQMELVAAWIKLLPDEPPMPIRVVNAIVKAANLVVEEMSQPYRPATPGMGLLAWIRCDDAGQSSKYMLWKLSPSPLRYQCGRGDFSDPTYQTYPLDPSDFGRCVGLLDAAPELRDSLPKMAECEPVWAALVAAWSELESLYREESPSGNAPKLYARMKSIINETKPMESV